METAPAPGGTALLKPTEAAVELRISKATVYRLINSGAIKTVRVGNLLRVERSALAAYIKSAA